MVDAHDPSKRQTPIASNLTPPPPVSDVATAQNHISLVYMHRNSDGDSNRKRSELNLSIVLQLTKDIDLHCLDDKLINFVYLRF